MDLSTPSCWHSVAAVDDLNDVSDYYAPTKDGFAETDEENEVYKINKENSEKYKEIKKITKQTPPVREIKAEELKENKIILCFSFLEILAKKIASYIVLTEKIKSLGSFLEFLLFFFISFFS